MGLVLLACRQLAVVAAVGAIAWAAGRLVSQALRRQGAGVDVNGGIDGGNADLRHADVGRRSIASARGTARAIPWPLVPTIGLALLSQGLLLLGMAGWLRAPILIPLMIGVLVAAAAAAGDGPRAWRFAWPSHRRLAVAILFLPPLLLTLYPPLGFDQTMYHLPYARAFAASGSVPVLPALRYPVFPQLAEMLNAAVLLFADDVATQAVGWLALVLCTALVFLWARELSSDAGGWLAAAIFAGSPIALYLSATGYVEPPLALFGLASLYAASRAIDDRGVRVAWIVAAGALAGTAAGVKYLGLYVVPGAALFLIAGRRPWRMRLRDLCIYAAAVLVALAPTYGRLLALTGNPIFPFYPSLFGSSAWSEEILLGKRGWEHFGAALTLLWDVTFRRDAVGHMPFFSPAFVLGTPIALIGAWRAPALRLPLLIAFGYILLAPVHAHYLLAIAPLLAIVIGSSAATLIAPWPGARRVLLGAAILLALGGDAYVVHRLARLGWPPTTPVERDRLLARQLPLYPAIAFLNETTGSGTGRRTPSVRIYGVEAERMVYYANGTLLGDHNGPASFARIAARVRDGRSLSEALTQIGVSYLLLPGSVSTGDTTAGTAAIRKFWIDEAASDPWLERVYGDGHATVYRVLPIGRPGSLPAD